MARNSEPPRHSVSVSGIVQAPDGRILAVKRAYDGRWVPPGGVLELNETLCEGVVREVLEETAMKVEPRRLTGVYKNMPRGLVALVFRYKAEIGAQRGVDETAVFSWVTADEVAELADEVFAVRVEDAPLSPIQPSSTSTGAPLCVAGPGCVVSSDSPSLGGCCLMDKFAPEATSFGRSGCLCCQVDSCI